MRLREPRRAPRSVGRAPVRHARGAGLRTSPPSEPTPNGGPGLKHPGPHDTPRLCNGTTALLESADGCGCPHKRGRADSSNADEHDYGNGGPQDPLETAPEHGNANGPANRRAVFRSWVRYRSFTRRTNLSPDHTSSTAATFTSTRPCPSPIARITSSVRSVATPDDFLGHEIHNMPAGASARASPANRRSSSRFFFVKNWMKSTGPTGLDLRVTPDGSLPSVRAYSLGALRMAIAQPSLIPSLSTSDRLEYPATPFPGLSPAFVDHPPDRAGRVVRDIQRPVRPHRHAHRAVLGSRAVLFPKAVRERLVAADRLAVLEGHEGHAVARLGERRTVPGAVERDERAAPIALGELGPRIERQAVRRPVSREGHQRLLLVFAASHLLAVAAVLGREHEVAELRVVVAIGPTEIGALRELEELLGRLLGALLDGEQLGPVLTQLIAPVLRGVQLTRGREGEPDGVADARGEAGAAQPGLVELRGVEPPHAGPIGELGAGVLAGRLVRAVCG